MTSCELASKPTIDKNSHSDSAVPHSASLIFKYRNANNESVSFNVAYQDIFDLTKVNSDVPEDCEIYFRPSEKTNVESFYSNLSKDLVATIEFTKAQIKWLTYNAKKLTSFLQKNLWINVESSVINYILPELKLLKSVFSKLKSVIIIEISERNIDKLSCLQIKKVKALGFKVALDDVDLTSRKHRLLASCEHVDHIKIIYSDNHHDLVKDYILNFNVNSLKRKKIILEQIEHKNQLQRIKNIIGVNYLQGYLFSIPRNIIHEI
ncbi:hypothetical protein [Vibrio chagasii]|uniref:hypothetical protein n=1 Tax=Vibrio chagasii TaxID=170679 RepID=UPI003736DA52